MKQENGLVGFECFICDGLWVNEKEYPKLWMLEKPDNTT
jgi:hypothetical protein